MIKYKGSEYLYGYMMSFFFIRDCNNVFFYKRLYLCEILAQ